MAFLNTTELVQRVVRRLRQVSSASTQLYAEDVILDMLIETYEMCREHRWWSHLTQWYERQLDGVNGVITVPINGARARTKDVQCIKLGNNRFNLPKLSSDLNPRGLTGTQPRYWDDLSFATDPNGTLLVQIYPRTALVTVASPLNLRVRCDTPNIFTNPAVVVPFDASCLVNGTAAKYAASDGTNPADVAMMQNIFDSRLAQLAMQEDAVPIDLDPRIVNPVVLDKWIEEP